MNTKVGRDIVSHDRPSACIDPEVKRSKVRLKVRGRMYILPVSVARSSSGGVAIQYAFPVL